MNRMNRLLLVILPFLLLLSSPALADQPLTVLFTSDIHSYFTVDRDVVEGSLREHGGAGRLMTLIRENTNDHTVLVDAGDFAMGNLLHTGFSTDAYELRLMGSLGFDATTFGNHEFDFAGTGAASMLRAAKSSGDPLPGMVIPANMNLTGTLTEEQQELSDALADMGAARYIIKEVGGIRIAIFGLMGDDAISCSPTSGVTWDDPIKSAKAVVKEIGDQADVIICISHSGTNGDGKTGEDINLAKNVPEIDVVISGHTHTAYHEAIYAGNAVLGSPGCYLSYLGRMELSVADDGKVTCLSYDLLSCDETVEPDEKMDAQVEGYLDEVEANYLNGVDHSQIIAFSGIQFKSLEQIYVDYEEEPLANLITDSYLYAFRQLGQDIDVGIVGVGTIRESLDEGYVTVNDAFKICSLGVGSDGSAGHPLVGAWIYGSELKTLAEIDAFLGRSNGSFKLHYAGMEVTVDVNRLPFDRVTSMTIVREDGSREKVESNKLYKVCGNMYGINMIGSISSRSYGLLKVQLKNADGTPVTDNYQLALKREDGTEVKEWEAFRDYLSSFEQVDGVSVIPESYAAAEGRKTVTAGYGLALISNPGPVTLAAIILVVLILGVIILLIVTRKKRKARRLRKREARKLKKQAKNH